MSPRVASSTRAAWCRTQSLAISTSRGARTPLSPNCRRVFYPVTEEARQARTPTKKVDVTMLRSWQAPRELWTPTQPWASTAHYRWLVRTASPSTRIQVEVDGRPVVKKEVLAETDWPLQKVDYVRRPSAAPRRNVCQPGTVVWSSLLRWQNLTAQLLSQVPRMPRKLLYRRLRLRFAPW